MQKCIEDFEKSDKMIYRIVKKILQYEKEYKKNLTIDNKIMPIH